MDSHHFSSKYLSPQLKMIVLIFILGLTCIGGQQIPPPEGNTLILMNVIDTLDSLSLQLKEFEEKVEAKFEEVQANVTGIIETQKTIQADIKQVQANVTGIIETQKTIQADIKLQETTLVAKIEVQETTLVAKIEEVQANVTGIIETQKTIQADIKLQETTLVAKIEEVQANVTGIIETQKSIQADIKQVQANVTGIIETQKSIQADIKRLQQCSTEAQLSQFQELVFKDDCVEGSHTCGDMSTCTDYFNRYECSCLPGYSGDGITCQDVDECSENNNICGDHATCQNNPGSYTCICDKNFRYVGNICQDVDECSENNNICGDHGTCQNNPGSYICICDKNYGYVGNTCQACFSPSLYLEDLGCISPIIDQKRSWDDMKTKCQVEGKRLLEGIKYKHLQPLANHFYPLISFYYVWIGMKDSRWITSGEEVTNDLWRSGEPNFGNEVCGYIYMNPSSTGLGDYTCSSSLHALCQSLPPY